jgi:hypothetical protein
MDEAIANLKEATEIYLQESPGTPSWLINAHVISSVAGNFLAAVLERDITGKYPTGTS